MFIQTDREFLGGVWSEIRYRFSVRSEKGKGIIAYFGLLISNATTALSKEPIKCT